MDYAPFIIRTYPSWDVLVHSEHYAEDYLGSVYIWSRQQGDRDIIDMSPGERNEFFDIAHDLKAALSTLFSPDRFNYLNLQNVAHHLHVHLIPRYRGPRQFDGKTFVDKEWGAPPVSRRPHLPLETLLTLRDAISHQLPK